MATTQVELVTPTGTLFSGQAEMVVCRTEGGDIAFLAHHMAYADELRFDVQGGFVEVNDNRVIVLCDAAEPAGTEP
jgi:F-type H+-transporting ATPase subunit epsilon